MDGFELIKRIRPAQPLLPRRNGWNAKNSQQKGWKPGSTTVPQFPESLLLRDLMTDAFVPALETTMSVTGYAYKVYDGKFPWVPDVLGLKPCKTGTYR